MVLDPISQGFSLRPAAILKAEMTLASLPVICSLILWCDFFCKTDCFVVSVLRGSSLYLPTGEATTETIAEDLLDVQKNVIAELSVAFAPAPRQNVR